LRFAVAQGKGRRKNAKYGKRYELRPQR